MIKAQILLSLLFYFMVFLLKSYEVTIVAKVNNEIITTEKPISCCIVKTVPNIKIENIYITAGSKQLTIATLLAPILLNAVINKI